MTKTNGPGVAASRSIVWWERTGTPSALAAAALVVGYADLWRGGVTVAPILLVVGYCILIPIAILR